MKSKIQYVCYMLMAAGMILVAMIVQACGCGNFTCPDNTPRTADAIQIFISEDTASGDGFFVGELANIMLIKVTQRTPVEYLDTIIPADGTTRVTSIGIGPITFGDIDNWTEFDYIIENVDPPVYHELTEINVDGNFDDGQCCEIYTNTKKEYKWDGQLVTDPNFFPLILR